MTVDGQVWGAEIGVTTGVCDAMMPDPTMPVKAARPPPRAILFDLGDTLIDFEPMDTRGVFREAARQSHEFLRARGYVPPPLDTYCRHHFRRIRWHYLWAKLRRRDFNSLRLLRAACATDAPGLGAEDLFELAWLWYAPIVAHSGTEQDLHATLADLRRDGYRLGIVSNTFVDGAVHDRHLDAFGLLGFFPVRVYSSQVGYRKPDPRIFRVALDALGVAPAETVFVGDLVKTDIAGAAKVGMRTVLKQPWGTPRSSRRADHVIREIADLPAVLAQLREAVVGERDHGCPGAFRVASETAV